MGKLLRRSNKSPDAEQLLTPRKQGFFGKRNNGVRSEDPEKPKPSSSRRLVTSFIKRKRLGDDDDDKQLSPLEEAPPLPWNNLGTPKTAPPSPELVGTVLARSNSRINHNHHLPSPPTGHNHHPPHHNVDGEETVMSDLTGTVSPYNNNAVHEEKASGITPPVTAQGVTFAESTPHRTESFYSAYSPSLGVFRTESGNVVNVGCDMPSGNYHTTPPSTPPPVTNVRKCSSTMLDQMLGVVDGACQRTVDLFETKRSNTGVSGNTREWGMAPSADDDESTCLETRADTFITRDTSTFAYPSTRNSTVCNTTPTGTLCTGTTSLYGTGTTSLNGATTGLDTLATNTVATPHSAPPLETNSIAAAVTTTKPLADRSLQLEGAMSVENTKSPAAPLEREPSTADEEEVLHENFELVLGQTGISYGNSNSGGEERDNVTTPKKEAAPPKKKGWTPKIMKKADSKNKKFDEEKKEEVPSVEVHRSSSNKSEPIKVETVLPSTKAATKPAAPAKSTSAATAAAAAKRAIAKPPDSTVKKEAAPVRSEAAASAKPTPAASATKPPVASPTTDAKDPPAFTATSPLSKQVGNQPAQFSPSAEAAEASNSASAPGSPIPTKQEQREALFQSVFGDDFTGQDIGVEIQSRKILQEQEAERLAASKPAPSPPPKKGLSGLVKRLRFGKVRRTKSTGSVIPKKATGSLSNNKLAVSKSALSPSPAPKKITSAAVAPTSPVPAPPPTSPKPPLPPTSPVSSPPASAKKGPTSPTATAASPGAMAASSPAPKKQIREKEEEEKKEVEDPKDVDTTFITDNTTNGPKIDKKNAPVAKSSEPTKKTESSPPAVKTVRSDIKGLPAQPGPLKDRSNSFRLPMGRTSKEPASPKSKQAFGSKTDADAKAADLESPVSISRLRSAPIKLSSSERLEEEKRQKAKKAAAVLNPPKLTWKSATDDQGRTYYYHRETRKTQWVKPPEFDAEMAAVKKYKEDLETAKKEATETQKVVDEYKSVEAIQAQLRKKTQRDFDPKVWQIKQEILDIVQTMPLPNGTNIEKLLIQYDGREEQLLANLRDLVESKPFDEPFQAPKKADPPIRQRSSASERSRSDPNLNISHASSSVSSSALHASVAVQQRSRTAISASTRISEKTYLTEQTEKVRNTSNGGEHSSQAGPINTIREGVDAISTGSISSANSHRSNPRDGDEVPLTPAARVPSKIPAVPRSRDLKVEEFTNARIAKETFNGEHVVPPSSPVRETVEVAESNQSDSNVSETRRSSPAEIGNAKTVAEQIVALSSLDDDDSYNGDYEETVNEHDNDTESEKMHTDSISALSEADVDYVAQKENFERARRRALDVAVEREDWDLAAALSEGMRQVKESLYGKPSPQREWTQTELDRFISENDWDAVSKYIAQMRDRSLTEPSPPLNSSGRDLSHLTTPRGRDPETGRDPDGYSPPKRMPGPAAPMDEGLPPLYVSEASKRAAKNTQSARRQQPHNQLNTSFTGSNGSSNSSKQRAQTRFGARSQLQHSDLTSMSSWGDSSSSYDSEYTDNSYESEEEHGYISLRVRRNEFEC